MRLGPCPKCGSRRVRTGKIYFLHLVRLALGTRRRYCRICRSRWIGTEKAVSPSAMLAAVLIFCAISGLALRSLKDEGWFAPQPGSHHAAWDEPWAANPAGSGLAGGIDAFLEGDVTGAYGQALGARIPGQQNLPIRWGGGQLMEDYSAYVRSGGGAGPQKGQSQDIQEVLRRLKAIGKTPQQVAREVDSSDKQTLWNKYGSNFASEEDARAAYDDYQKHRSEFPR